MKKLLEVVNIQNEIMLKDASGEYEIVVTMLVEDMNVGELWLVDETEEGVELLTNMISDTVYIEEEHGLVEYRLDSQPTSSGIPHMC